MSVYTKVTEPELGQWLAHYDVGALVHLQPIAAGIENTNYFVDTARGRYVLTLFERLPRTDLPFYLDLMTHLAGDGIPCPLPIADRGRPHARRAARQARGAGVAARRRVGARARPEALRRGRPRARPHARLGAHLRRHAR